MPLTRLAALDRRLRAAGIPISGVSGPTSLPGLPEPTATAAQVTVTYDPAATAQQVAAGEAIREGFDYRPRRSLTRAQIVQGYQALTTAQRATLQAHLLTLLLRSSPADVDDLLTETGVPLAVDEVVPT